MQLTNKHNIPLLIAVYLGTDNYDHKEAGLSATTLIKPIRQIILGQRSQEEVELPTDVMSNFHSAIGSSIHEGIEKSLTNPKKVLKALGHPKSVYKNILLNPTEEDIQNNPKGIPIYCENRSFKMFKVNGEEIKLSGKYDFVVEGVVTDVKNTTAYVYEKSVNSEEYSLQGSIYRVLNPEIITEDYIDINFIIRDWAKYNTYRENYPPLAVVSKRYPLKSIEETINFIESKMKLILDNLETPEEDLPLCTPEDLWQDETTYKYYSKATNTRATKNFTDHTQAVARFEKDGSTGVIKTVEGQAKACNYCPGFHLCSQKDSLIEAGTLTISD